VSKQLEMNYYNKFIDKHVEVLIEKVNKGMSFGHTDNFIPVVIEKKLEKNNFYNVKIYDIDYPNCIGK
jgi:tRNA A37 methylthiotransferase MiaB